MKGVIIAGGDGTRLQPVTLTTNKHLLCVYNKPVIYYGIEKLVEAGIDKIMVVTSPYYVDSFVKLLGSGQNFIAKRKNFATTNKRWAQVQIVYAIQNRPLGIANALYLAKDYVGQDNCALYLGDNIFEDDVSVHIRNFKDGALIFLKKVADPARFGVATIGVGGAVLEIEEKPSRPKSNLAVTGLYLYDHSVFNKMLEQKASVRGEYEITYINNKYLAEGKLKSVTLKKKWFDIGTFDSLLDASVYAKSRKL